MSPERQQGAHGNNGKKFSKSSIGNGANLGKLQHEKTSRVQFKALVDQLKEEYLAAAKNFKAD